MKHIILLLVAVLSLSADFYLYDGSSRTKFTPITNGEISSANLNDIAFMQRQNSQLQIINDEQNYRYSYINVQYVTIESQPLITVLRDHNDSKLKNGEYLTQFGDVDLKDGYILQIYYLDKWCGIYLGSKTSLNQALKAIKSKEKKHSRKQVLITNY